MSFLESMKGFEQDGGLDSHSRPTGRLGGRQGIEETIGADPFEGVGAVSGANQADAVF